MKEKHALTNTRIISLKFTAKMAQQGMSFAVQEVLREDEF